MKPLILSYKNVTFKEFVSFWSSFYNYKKEDLYVTRIKNKQFSEGDLLKLFEWKNGGRLSKKKVKVLQAIISKIDTINKLKVKFSLNVFLKEFKFVKGVIWKIYLLHIINSGEYAIFDQHVCRAFYFLAINQKKEIPVKNIEKEKLYFGEYIDFFR